MLVQAVHSLGNRAGGERAERRLYKCLASSKNMPIDIRNNMGEMSEVKRFADGLFTKMGAV